MKAAVIVFPGSNCDRDVAVALKRVTGHAPRMIWHRDTALPALDLIVVPGGFSYGDYLRSGAMAAHSPIMAAVTAQAAKGVRVLGICNGFQILTEAGLLPGVLMRNQGLSFICRDVLLKVETSASDFTAGYNAGQVVRIPVAHGDGNYFAEPAVLDRLEDEDRVAFRYCDEGGAPLEAANPNGSRRNIAGILNETRTVLGMMPHPERLADPLLGGTDGAPMFRALAAALS
ncbi:phosphoribosylformylglycinamidine synthase subunit PurQ [Oleispirillum naphthae]|uniref:phosphoribosylformylglycinamidine synthase subunit PurQ n=1 Tax=Oleispirillum naphthae TaxID=2838853 RepID=UPI0030822415